VGQKGHGRRDYSHLPTIEEDVSVFVVSDINGAVVA